MCPKRRFDTRDAALDALAVIIETAIRASRPRGECAIYRCPTCGCWHLTSKTGRLVR